MNLRQAQSSTFSFNFISIFYSGTIRDTSYIPIYIEFGASSKILQLKKNIPKSRYDLPGCPCQFISSKNMMTSWNGNIFRVTGPLYGEFTGHRWIPLTKASDVELWYFLCPVALVRRQVGIVVGCQAGMVVVVKVGMVVWRRAAWVEIVAHWTAKCLASQVPFH